MRARFLIVPAAMLGVMTSAPAVAQRARISPYIEVQQVLDAQLSGQGSGDVLTYTSVAAGIDASVTGRRAEGTISYRYERLIPWDDDFSTQDIHSGVARGRLAVVPNVLSIDAGALASRARVDIRGPAPEIFVGDQANVTQVYSVYAGPSLATRVGALDVTANYRFGYTKVEDNGGFSIPGQPVLDSYDSSTIHQVDGSVGMAAGLLPFGWTVSAGWMRENANQLSQRYDGKYVRGDVTLPVTPTLALTGGVGYEDIEVSQRTPLRDVNGAPVLDRNGRFVSDPNAPRQLAYDTDGLIYDAGVIWRPNRRLTLQVRAGYRYGDEAYTGSLDYAISERSGLQVGVYNYIDSFGRSLNRDLQGLPTQFGVSRNPFTNNLGAGCVIGTNPGTGGCLEDTFQSISTSNYRARGVFALYSRTAGRWSMSFGGGYTQRKYLAPADPFFSVDGVVDESIQLQATVARRLSRRSGIDAAIYAAWFDSGIEGSSDVTGYGATTSYYHTFGERLSANASLGIYGFDQSGIESELNGSLLLGMRYQF